MYSEFFWLHIKKSAGISTRKLLQPYYVEVDRTRQPKCFLQASHDEYNDILNNFRVTLGEYQFKRCLFAKKYLYPDSWEKIFSFAFSREPIDRCCSMYHYLYWHDGNLKHRLQHTIKRTLSTKKIQYNTMYAFDTFLDFCQQARTSPSIYTPIDNHFTTHTAPMFDDITDLEIEITSSNENCRDAKIVIQLLGLPFENFKSDLNLISLSFVLDIIDTTTPSSSV